MSGSSGSSVDAGEERVYTLQNSLDLSYTRLFELIKRSRTGVEPEQIRQYMNSQFRITPSMDDIIKSGDLKSLMITTMTNKLVSADDDESSAEHLDPIVLLADQEPDSKPTGNLTVRELNQNLDYRLEELSQLNTADAIAKNSVERPYYQQNVVKDTYHTHKAPVGQSRELLAPQSGVRPRRLVRPQKGQPVARNLRRAATSDMSDATRNAVRGLVANFTIRSDNSQLQERQNRTAARNMAFVAKYRLIDAKDAGTRTLQTQSRLRPPQRKPVAPPEVAMLAEDRIYDDIDDVNYKILYLNTKSPIRAVSAPTTERAAVYQRIFSNGTESAVYSSKILADEPKTAERVYLDAQRTAELKVKYKTLLTERYNRVLATIYQRWRDHLKARRAMYRQLATERLARDAQDVEFARLYRCNRLMHQGLVTMVTQYNTYYRLYASITTSRLNGLEYSVYYVLLNTFASAKLGRFFRKKLIWSRIRRVCVTLQLTRRSDLALTSRVFRALRDAAVERMCGYQQDDAHHMRNAYKLSVMKVDKGFGDAEVDSHEQSEDAGEMIRAYVPLRPAEVDDNTMADGVLYGDADAQDRMRAEECYQEVKAALAEESGPYEYQFTNPAVARLFALQRRRRYNSRDTVAARVLQDSVELQTHDDVVKAAPGRQSASQLASPEESTPKLPCVEMATQSVYHERELPIVNVQCGAEPQAYVESGLPYSDGTDTRHLQFCFLRQYQQYIRDRYNIQLLECAKHGYLAAFDVLHATPHRPPCRTAQYVFEERAELQRCKRDVHHYIMREALVHWYCLALKKLNYKRLTQFAERYRQLTLLAKSFRALYIEFGKSYNFHYVVNKAQCALTNYFKRWMLYKLWANCCRERVEAAKEGYLTRNRHIRIRRSMLRQLMSKYYQNVIVAGKLRDVARFSGIAGLRARTFEALKHQSALFKPLYEKLEEFYITVNTIKLLCTLNTWQARCEYMRSRSVLARNRFSVKTYALSMQALRGITVHYGTIVQRENTLRMWYYRRTILGTFKLEYILSRQRRSTMRGALCAIAHQYAMRCGQRAQLATAMRYDALRLEKYLFSGMMRFCLAQTILQRREEEVSQKRRRDVQNRCFSTIALEYRRRRRNSRLYDEIQSRYASFLLVKYFSKAMLRYNIAYHRTLAYSLDVVRYQGYFESARRQFAYVFGRRELEPYSSAKIEMRRSLIKRLEAAERVEQAVGGGIQAERDDGESEASAYYDPCAEQIQSKLRQLREMLYNNDAVDHDRLDWGSLQLTASDRLLSTQEQAFVTNAVGSQQLQLSHLRLQNADTSLEDKLNSINLQLREILERSAE